MNRSLMDAIPVGGNNMNIQDRLQLLCTLEQAAYELVNKISEELPKGTRVRVREMDYVTGEIEEKVLTVVKVTYYESELSIQCKSDNGYISYYGTDIEMEVIK
ncbi:hypothetical protein vBEcoMphAPEC6_00880 [Escherichia phage ph0011]|nr:hypothetical protein vBEcoMphAPEC6_00880 [Escherichia phage ph0011]